MQPNHKLMKKLLLSVAALIACAAISSQAAISVGSSGAGPITFDTQPAVGDFSTLTWAGGSGAPNDTITLDAAVQTNDASIINVQLGAAGGTPPAAGAAAQWASAGHFIQTRPTGVAYQAIMATLQNNSGAAKNTILIAYDQTVAGTATLVEEVYGHRAYYSMTGAANSWVQIPALDTVDNTLGTVAKSASLDLSATPWAIGATMYLLWADDNGSGTPDNAIEIDNFTVSFPGIAPTITQQPVSTNVLQCHSASFTAEAQGSAPLVYRWFHGVTAIDTTVNPSAGTPTLMITNAQSSDGGQYHVHVSNGVGPGVDSSTVTLTVNPDTQPPVLTLAVGKSDLVTVVVTFSEPVASTSVGEGAQDPFNYLVQTPDGTTDSIFLISALLNNETNVVLTLDHGRNPALDYVVVVNGVKDVCGQTNTIVANSTIPLTPELSYQQGDINGYSGTQDTELEMGGGMQDTPQGAKDFFNVDGQDGTPQGPSQGLLRFD